MAGFTGPSPRDLDALAAGLRGADARLRTNLRDRWKDAARPAVDEAQKAITGAGPVKHDRGLRKEIAATVHSEVRLAASGVQVSVVSRGAEMPPGKGNLPRDFDRGTWNHPVWGTEAQLQAHLDAGGRAAHGRGWTWVRQFSQHPGWFTLTMAGQQGAFTDAAQRALDETNRETGG